jgi:hypothetical protein
MILNTSDQMLKSTLIGLAESKTQNDKFWDQLKNTRKF